jgi:hypothetical protein
MNRIAKLCRTFVVAMSALAFAAGGAVAAPRAAQPAAPQTVVPVQADCYAIGQRVAAEMGGRLLNVSQSGNNCVITVVIAGQNGQLRRERVVVPAN